MAVALSSAQLFAGNALRVGIDVPEPKLIRETPIPYPSPDVISWYPYIRPVVLNILIDEQGLVAGIKAEYSESELSEDAEHAVKKWRFAPTIINGKAVPVTADVVITLPYGRTPGTVDMSITTRLLELLPGNVIYYLCSTPILLKNNGNTYELPAITRNSFPRSSYYATNDDDPLKGAWVSNSGQILKERNEKPVDACEMVHDYWIYLEPDAAFAAIEAKLKGSKPFSKYRLHDPRYFYPDRFDGESVRPNLERLYYTTSIVSNGSRLIQFTGLDPQVQPPRFDIDLNQLSKNLDISRYRGGAVFFYTVFVDEKGEILGVESENLNRRLKDQNVEILGKAHVVTPGLRNGVPVPTAVIIAVPVMKLADN